MTQGHIITSETVESSAERLHTFKEDKFNRIFCAGLHNRITIIGKENREKAVKITAVKAKAKRHFVQCQTKGS